MMNFSPYSIIEKKKNKKTLTKDEIEWFITGLVKGTVKDYQMTALLMAIAINGMNDEETAYLTDTMLQSGEVFTFKEKNVVDKHSTGGIGDKTSFILAPIAAACGIKVPMIAGRGLGFTGGTVDKIESIKGFDPEISSEKFIKLLNKNNIVMMGQTENIAPADRIIYGLRDVTATVDSIPLITASIMSKKLAEGTNGLVMDIKVGSGAFIGKMSDGRELARCILSTAKRFNKKSVALLTNMDQPLGNMVGNSLEIIESIDVLKGKGPKDLTDLSIALAANMIHIGGKATNYRDAEKKARLVVENGKALKVFRTMLKAQGGDDKVIDDYSRLPMAKHRTQVLAPKHGYIKSFVNRDIGMMCTELGGGRKVKKDKIDFGVGFEFHKKIGDKVIKGEPILTIFHNKNQINKVAGVHGEFLKNIIKISTTKVVKPKLIFEKITK
jgi:pyrimidine-nucleoside phosphorylase